MSRLRHGEGDLRGALNLTGAGDAGASLITIHCAEVAPTACLGEQTSEAQGPSTPEWPGTGAEKPNDPWGC